ncbi:MAG TPA: ATP-binding protein [Methanomassiliicoccales archaeon]|nr:ATP-binding protein [Methanomassiliicoccales archaeon]
MGAEVFADHLITKVFQYPIDNAVRYGDDITSIHFSVEAVDGVRSIVREDDGAGIVVEMKIGLFTCGFGKDHGLGLFLSHEILAITDITIGETGEPGHGARFVMKVPPNKFRTA